MTTQLFLPRRRVSSQPLLSRSPEIHGPACRHIPSKFALEAWISVLPAELEGTGVRTSVIRPGPTETGHADTWFPAETTAMFAEWNDRKLMRHWVLLTAHDVASTIPMVVGAPARVNLRLVDVAPSVPRADSG